MNTSKKPAMTIFGAGDALNVAAAGSFETLVSTYQTIQHYILEDKYSLLKTVTNRTFMFEFSVKKQGLKVLSKPKTSTKEMVKIYKGFDVYEMYTPRRRNRRRIIL